MQIKTTKRNCPSVLLYGITTFYITLPSLDRMNLLKEELRSKEDPEMPRDGGSEYPEW